jgi:4-amino-4-deoxy-L-arabinose transferase-like glycosyltransferase
MDSDKPVSRVGVLLLVTLLVAAGGLLRFWRIGAKSIWLDEAATLGIVERPYFSRAAPSGRAEPGLFAAVAAKDTHPPLYYALLRAWMLGGDGIARARAMSAVVGTATIGLMYLLARVFLSRLGALAATALLSASAYQVYFGQEARHYVVAAFLVALSTYLLSLLLTGPRQRGWALWLALALTNAAALYTFYYTAFAVVGQFVVLVLHARSQGRGLVARWCAWQLVPAMLFAAYVPVVLEKYRMLEQQVRRGTYTVEAGDLAATASQFVGGFAAELSGPRTGTALTVGCVLALGLLFAAAAGLRNRRTAVVLGLVWLLLPVAIVILFPFKGHIYEPKHIIFAAPGLAFLGGVAVHAAEGRWRTLPLALVGMAVAWNITSLVGGDVVGVSWPRGYYDRRVEKENWRVVASRIAQKAQEGDALVLNPPYTELVFTYCYRPDRLGVPCPKLVRQYGRTTYPRTWLVTAVSNVALPSNAVEEQFAKYGTVFHEEYHDLVGSIVVKLLSPPPSE